MIPLKDDIPSNTFPIVNVTIIVINVAVFLYQFFLGPEVEPFIERFGVIPADYFQSASSGGGVLRLFTSMFLHGGFMHVGGNMLYLWIFGDNVEDRMGHGRYIVFYLLCGLAAGVTHILTNQESNVPTIGASGAVAGVLGAYTLLYPRARVLVLIPIFYFMEFIRLPALAVLGIWFVMQLFQGTLALSANSTATGGVAWWAHVGGFLFGISTIYLFAKKRTSVAIREADWR